MINIEFRILVGFIYQLKLRIRVLPLYNTQIHAKMAVSIKKLAVINGSCITVP